MTTPSTVSATGYFRVTLNESAAGEGSLRMSSATKGAFTFGGKTWKLAGDPAAKKFTGTAPGSVLNLKIINRRSVKGTLDGVQVELKRSVLRAISASEMAQFDAGPTGAMKALLDSTPDYAAEVGDATTFWYAFGPVLYRGRLDGSARVLCIASDPGPSECLPFIRRTLVGDSGQKVQGFLAKLGLTRSYVLVNGSAFALRPSQKSKGLKALKTNAAIREARHALYDSLLLGEPQAVIAFGDVAHDMYDQWSASNPLVSSVPVFKLAHPAAVDRNGTGDDAALKGWNKAIRKLRTLVTPDPDGEPGQPNFGSYFTELDYDRIPRWDMPKNAPTFAGDDSWGRGANPRHNNCCARPSPDDMATLVMTPPEGLGELLYYKYKNGNLLGAKRKNGQNVPVDAFGIPT